jgi:hypothetical protein
MTTSSDTADTNEYIQWIEDSIAKGYVNCHDYDEFQDIQRIGFGGFSVVYQATWECRYTVVALKSFKNNIIIMKEMVNEVK